MISPEDNVLIARIAFEAESVANKAVHPALWDEQDDHVKTETLQRLDRCLTSLDSSMFGKIARSAAAALRDAGLIDIEDEDVGPVDAADRTNRRNETVEVSRSVLEAGASPDDLITAGTLEEGLESYPGEAASAQPNHRKEGVEVVHGSYRDGTAFDSGRPDGLDPEDPTDEELDELTKPGVDQ